MQESKETSWAEAYDTESGTESASAESATASNDDQALEPDGWQQYRKWISKAPVPRQRRMGVDPSLYTWKGYRTWTEQVKRKWTDT